MAFFVVPSIFCYCLLYAFLIFLTIRYFSNLPKPLANYSRSLTFLFVGICRGKVFTTKKGRTNSLSPCNMSRTIGRHSSSNSKATSSNTKKRIRTSRQEHNGKRGGISFSSYTWTRMTNKKWHISCHFRVFTGTFRATFGLLMISRKPQALPGLSRKVIAISPYAL